MARRTPEVEAKSSFNLPPKKLSYKGCTYILAKTREDMMWDKVSDLLTAMLKSTKSDTPSVHKRGAIASSYQELKILLKDLGVDF